MKTEDIKKTLNEVRVNKDIWNTLVKDRLDFGFDSIYFRYSEIVEELSWFKEAEAKRNGNLNFNRKHWCDTKRMHFYDCLEQLTHAHTQEENNEE